MGTPTAQAMIAELKVWGMTDEQIALETDVSQPTITRIHNGIHPDPRHKTWAAISALYLKVAAEQASPRQQANKGGAEKLSDRP